MPTVSSARSRSATRPLSARTACASAAASANASPSRAFLRDPWVVLLDEFTAHLDPDTEQSVLDAFDRLAEGRTALVVAHRPRTVERAHRIVALDRGQVIDEPAGLVPRP